jgi:hypothetical protein
MKRSMVVRLFDRITCGGSFGWGGLLLGLRCILAPIRIRSFFIGKFGSEVGMRLRRWGAGYRKI